ncbi:hypothetical protein E6H36_08015 [Candidatus Bathyarchaeota archaeon]|nr:MAG: hypothetical protein E6H36_08015 [Candidatus Bathyarchaeota archaeon]
MMRVKHRQVSRVAMAVLILLIVCSTSALGSMSTAGNHSPKTTIRTSNPQPDHKDHSEWFYSQRASRQGIPRDAYPHAMLQLGQISSASDPVGGSWMSVGPSAIQNCGVTGGLCSGRVTAIALDPTHAGTVYLGAAQGGVWKTTNSGASWVPLTDNQPSLAVGSIAVDSSGTIYVGTGEGNQSCDSYYGAGILKSTDGGNSWTVLGATTFLTSTVGRVVVNPSITSNLLVATNQGFTDSSTDACGYVPSAVPLGIYESFDSGATWSLKLAGTGYDVVLDPTNPSTIYAAASGSVYKSTDSGSTWAALAGGLPSGRRTSLAISQSNPLTIYTLIDTGVQAQLFKSLDGGSNWSSINIPSGLCDGQCWYDLYVAVDPTNVNILYLGGKDLYRTNNGGSSWIDTGGYSGYVHPDQHAIAFSPFSHNNVYVGNDGGVWSTNMASTCSPSACWTNLNAGLGITQFQFIATHPMDPNTYFGGTQDNGSPERSGTSNVWNLLVGGDGGWTAFDPTAPTTMYHNFYGVLSQRSVDGGQTWATINNGIVESQDCNGFRECLFYIPMALDLSNPGNLYLGTCRLYKTTNRGNSWSTILALAPCGGSLISAIAVAPSDGGYVYFATNRGKFYASSNSGASFVEADSGLPPAFLTKIAIDPSNPLRVAVTFSGFGNGHVYITSNSGGSWSNISSNLPDIPTNSVLLDSTNHLYVGTDMGVFFSTNSGSTWNVFGTGLPGASVFDLALTADGRLVAATHGRGVWVNTNRSSFEGLSGQYWNNSFFGAPLSGCASYNTPTSPSTAPTATATDPNVNFGAATGWNWHPFDYGGEFSVKWIGAITATKGSYTFRLASDDGSWLFIDAGLVLNHGGRHSPTDTPGTGSISLGQGIHQIEVDYYETCGAQSGVDLSWTPPGASGFVIVPTFVLAPPPRLDGQGVSSGSCLISGRCQLLSTKNAPDVIVLVASCQTQIGSSPTTCDRVSPSVGDFSGLQFTQHASYCYTGASFSSCFWEYYAVANFPLIADNITAVPDNSSVRWRMNTFGVASADTDAVFDTSSQVSQHCGAADVGPADCTVNFATSQTSRLAPYEFLFVSTSMNDAPPCSTPSAQGWSLMGSDGRQETDFQVASFAQGSYSFTCRAFSDPLIIMADGVRGQWPDFSIKAGSNSVTSNVGSTATVTVTMTPLNGFIGTVNATAVESPSEGLVCTLSPSSLSLGAAQNSTLSCTGATGTYNVTVTGSSASLSHSLSVIVRFQDFTISTDRGSTISTQGSESNFKVIVTGIGAFSGNVTLACGSQLPAGVSCSFSPSSAQLPFNSTLTLATSSSTPSGYYPIGIKGAANSTLRSTTSYLHVVPPDIFQYSLTFNGMNATIIGNLSVNSTSGTLIGPTSFNIVNGTDGTLKYSKKFGVNLSIDTSGRAVFIGEIPISPNWLAVSCTINVYGASSRCTFSRTPDLNQDGIVSIIDVATVAIAFGGTPTSPNWNAATDLNDDGVVDIQDVATVALYFGASLSS